MKNKVLTLLGFATKAGKLSFGAAAAESALYSGKAKLVLVSSEISPKTRKEMTFHSDKCNIECVVLDEIDIITLSDAVGRKCGVLSVNDSSFAESLTKELGGNVNDK